MSFLFTSHLDFSYEGAPEALFRDLSIHFPPGWTSVVGANGAGKTTLLRLLAGELAPASGSVARSGAAVLCRQETAEPPVAAAGFFESCDAYAFRLRDRLRLEPEMPERWEELSFGERKRLEIGCALFARPEVLCVDEPTNHLDGEARQLLAEELRRFRGIGVLVSHDRELLDLLSAQTLFLDAGGAVLRPGGFSAGRKLAEAELETRMDAVKQLKKELKHSKLELQRRREKEQQARNRDSKRKLDRHDRDGKGRIDAARVTGRDKKPGALAASQAGAVAGIEANLKELGSVGVRRLGLKIPYGAYAAKNVLYESGPGSIPLRPGRQLELPALVIGNRDRIGLTGVNGAGKSTLLRRIVDELKLPASDYLYLPQELDEAMTREIYRELKSLSRDDFSRVMNVVASLGSRPERVLDSADCSPGEWRKLFFGLGVLRRVHLIVMDEPTNHLDLPSIECLEAALGECEAALLLVSHDLRFLRSSCSIHWRIEGDVLRKEFFS